MKNIAQKIKTSLPTTVSQALEAIKINKGDFRCYLVGGIVRDLLLGREIFDVDITVEGDAIELAEFLETKTSAKILQTQPELRTAKIRFKNGVEIDFASTRTEAYPEKGRLPVLVKTGCGLMEDALRRDFTINAMAASLNSENFGEIIDNTGGLEDLEKKQLRILHKGSFIDDPTRIIRGLKFAVRFGFELESETLKLQEEYLKNPNPDISYSRLKSELIQAFSLPFPQVWNKFISQKIFRLINPDFDKKIDSKNAIALIERFHPENRWLVRLAPVFAGSAALELTNFTKIEKKIITDLEKAAKKAPPRTNIEVYKFFSAMEKESVIAYYLLTDNASAIRFLDEMAEIKPQITGEDIQKAGMPPSGVYAEIFDAILEEKLSGNLVTREDELEFLKFLIKELKK